MDIFAFTCKLYGLLWCAFHFVSASVRKYFCGMSMNLHFGIRHTDYSMWNKIVGEIDYDSLFFFFAACFLSPSWRYHLLVTVMNRCFSYCHTRKKRVIYLYRDITVAYNHRLSLPATTVPHVWAFVATWTTSTQYMRQQDVEIDGCQIK